VALAFAVEGCSVENGNIAAAKNSFVWRGTLPELIAVSAVDRNGNCGKAAVLKSQ